MENLTNLKYKISNQSRAMSIHLNSIMKKKINLKKKHKVEGFSLIEVAVALTTMGICLAYAMPVILYSKINNSKSEVRTGALMVAQKVFDDIRGRNFSSIPQTNRMVNNTVDTAAVTGPPALPLLPKIPADQATALGRDYNVAVRYCEVEADCTESYKTFKITIRDKSNTNAQYQASDSSIIYEMEAAFTDFK
jgi:type II secretory pathway pseudopilin PulG